MSTAAGTTGVFDQGAYRIQLGNAGAAGGDMASVLNPFGEDVIITFAALNITTASTGASTIDVGVGSSATTAYDTLIDGHQVCASIDDVDFITDAERENAKRKIIERYIEVRGG